MRVCTRSAVLLAICTIPAGPAAAAPQGGPDPVAEVARRVEARFDPRATYDTTLPFAAMRDAGDDRVEVCLEQGGSWIEWQAIDGVPTGRIVATCRRAFGTNWWKRLSEDLPQVVALMGHELGPRVTLTLRDAAGKSTTRTDVPMTIANRQAVKSAGYRQKAVESPAGSDARTVGDLAARVREAFDPRAFATTSPFVAMSATDTGIVVRLADGEASYQWLAIDDVPSPTIEAVCRAAFGPAWWKRITEDLPQVLALMGTPVGERVTLELRPLDGGDVLRRRDVAMTAANRRAVRTGRIEPTTPAPPAGSAAMRLADVAALERLLETRFSYARLRGDALPRALEALRAAAASASPASFPLALQECIAAAGDGHAGLLGWERAVEGPWLPFLLEPVGGRVVAIQADRGALASPSHPYLAAIDGEPLQVWIDAATRLVAQGAPQLVRRRGLRTLRDIQALRLLRGLPRTTVAQITLEDADGAQQVREVELAAQRPTYGTWPRPTPRLHRVLDAEIGYLRIAEMNGDAAFLAAIDTAMRELKATRGLVVDVRGNGGGTRDALRRLLPYLLPDAEPARVVNVAAPRLGSVDAEALQRGEALADRGLYPATWPAWSAAAKAAIEAASAAFRPEWQPPAEDFGPWHWCVVERRDNPAAFAYRAPVVVLIDGNCFSATDIFVCGLRGLPGVTLMGQPTGGGSGRARTHRLPSGLTVRLSTMASFQPSGALYDGNGIPPDVVVEPAIADFLGRSDRVLDAAVAHLRR